MNSKQGGKGGRVRCRGPLWCRPLVNMSIFLVALVGIFVLPLAAGAEHVTATIAAGTGPAAVAVNPATNRIYVANQGSGTVTVIDGATTAAITAVVGTTPRAVAVNPATN